MISDVLFQAIDDIKGYQRRLPECYITSRPAIEKVKRIMSALKTSFDVPSDNEAERLLDAIGRIDTSEVDRIIDRRLKENSTITGEPFYDLYYHDLEQPADV
jgi:hypothetical protein